MPKPKRGNSSITNPFPVLDFNDSLQYSDSQKSISSNSYKFIDDIHTLPIIPLSELVVHKKKIDQVMQWITDSSVNNKVMIISGPSGCGKTTVVRSLCNHLSITLRELSSEDMILLMNESQICDANYSGNRWEYMSQLQHFTSLLHPQNSPVIFLLKDIPLHTKFYRTSLSKIILKCSTDISNIRWIIIMTDNSGSNSIELKQFLSTELLSSPNVISIYFNQIAPTLMRKALSKYSMDIHNNFTRSCIDKAIIQSDGDLRAAKLYLEWQLVPCNIKNDTWNPVTESNICISQSSMLSTLFENTMYDKRKNLINICELVSLFCKITSFYHPEWIVMRLFDRYLQYLPSKDDEMTMDETWSLSESFSISDMLSYNSNQLQNELPNEIYCLPIRSLQLRKVFAVPSSNAKRHHDDLTDSSDSVSFSL